MIQQLRPKLIFSRSGLNLKRVVAVAVAQPQPDVGGVEPHRAHALPLPPVRLLVPDQALAGKVLGQDVDAQRGQRDAVEAGRAEKPADDVAGGAGGHGQPAANIGTQYVVVPT